MAITGGDRLVWRKLRELGAIPERPTVLEIGRANWYGDVPSCLLEADLREHAEGPLSKVPQLDTWTVADLYYEAMLRRPERTAIDLDPCAEGAIRHDLNQPLSFDLWGQFDVVINTGTCEHVFDQKQVWQSCHFACRPGGLMVHAVPLWGWLDHGFVNYQPTFVADVAAENEYEVLCWFLHEIKTGWGVPVACPAGVIRHQARSRDHSAMMHFAYRRISDAPFRVPMQGVYSNRTTPAQQESWLVNR